MNATPSDLPDQPAPATPGSPYVRPADGADPRDRDHPAIAEELEGATIDASDPAASGDPRDVDPAGYPHAPKPDHREGRPTGS